MSQLCAMTYTVAGFLCQTHSLHFGGCRYSLAEKRGAPVPPETVQGLIMYESF